MQSLGCGKPQTVTIANCGCLLLGRHPTQSSSKLRTSSDPNKSPTRTSFQFLPYLRFRPRSRLSHVSRLQSSPGVATPTHRVHTYAKFPDTLFAHVDYTARDVCSCSSALRFTGEDCIRRSLCHTGAIPPRAALHVIVRYGTTADRSTEREVLSTLDCAETVHRAGRSTHRPFHIAFTGDLTGYVLVTSKIIRLYINGNP